jgi:hypothetical protein
MVQPKLVGTQHTQRAANILHRAGAFKTRTCEYYADDQYVQFYTGRSALVLIATKYTHR